MPLCDYLRSGVCFVVAITFLLPLFKIGFQKKDGCCLMSSGQENPIFKMWNDLCVKITKFNEVFNEMKTFNPTPTIRYSFILFSFLLISTLPSFSQYEISKNYADMQNKLYDSLGIKVCKEYRYYGRTKVLKSRKKYDDKGFLISHEIYDGGKRKKTASFHYQYNHETLIITETRLSSLSGKMDTVYTGVEKYLSNGKIREKQEVITEYADTVVYHYEYDDFGNCITVKKSLRGNYIAPREKIWNKVTYQYDGDGKILQQFQEKGWTWYTSTYQFDSNENMILFKEASPEMENMYQEFYTYNAGGMLTEIAFVYDSLYVPNEIIAMPVCLDGGESYVYDEKGRLIVEKHFCNRYNKPNDTFGELDEKRFVYKDNGLLVKVVDFPKRKGIRKGKPLKELKESGLCYRYK